MKATPKFIGKVVSGHFVADNIHQMTVYLQAKFENKQVECIIRKPREPKSMSQLAYFHGVICKIGGEALGYTIEEMKQALKEEILQPIEKHNRLTKTVMYIYPSLRDMKKPEMSKFIDDSIIKLAKMSVYIPEPNANIYYEDE